MRETSSERAGLLAALAQTLIMVANYFISKSTVTVFPLFALAMLRMAGASAMVLVILGVAGGIAHWNMPARDAVRIVALGAFGVAINQTAFLVGLERSTPAHAALLYALTPALVFTIGWLRGSEGFTLGRLIGIGCAFVGVVMVLIAGAGVNAGVAEGDLIIFIGVATWSLFTALASGFLRRYGTLKVTTIALGGGTLAFAPIGVPAVLFADLSAIPVGAWLGLSYLIVMSSVAGYLLWYFAIKRLPATRVAVFNNLQAPLTALAGWALFEEPITTLFVAGAVAVLLGVWLTQREALAEGPSRDVE